MYVANVHKCTVHRKCTLMYGANVHKCTVHCRTLKMHNNVQCTLRMYINLQYIVNYSTSRFIIWNSRVPHGLEAQFANARLNRQFDRSRRETKFWQIPRQIYVEFSAKLFYSKWVDLQRQCTARRCKLAHLTSFQKQKGRFTAPVRSTTL